MLKAATILAMIAGCQMGSEARPVVLAPDEVQRLAVDAYIYGYPLVTMEMSRWVMTNVQKPAGTRAPLGRFALLRRYPTADFKDVTAPNADTLYALCWLDVAKEPWVLCLPVATERYYLFPMLDAWTGVFASPGTRTTGTGSQQYAITGPRWKGKLPPGVLECKSSTSIVWLLGRVYCTGTPDDYAAVHEWQDKISVTPLSYYGRVYGPIYQPLVVPVNPDIDMQTPVREQVEAMSATDFFDLLATLLRDNPPAAADAPMVAEMARLGMAPGKPCDWSQFNPATLAALREVPKLAQDRILGWFKQGVSAGDNQFQNGWVFTTKTGQYGTNYLQRALVAAIGLGANLPHDAIYPTSETDAHGQPYYGTNHYTLHFNHGELPPVKGFWSVTLYNPDYFFYANPLNRYTLSARDDLKTNEDGSVDLYLQHDSPGAGKETNWLPAPAGKFVLMLRLYWPKETPPSILDGTWKIPPVRQVTE